MKRKDRILMGAVALAELRGYQNLTRRAVATHAGVANGTVSYHFVSMGNLQTEVVRYAMKHKRMDIIRQALSNCHPLVNMMSKELKVAAVEALAL